MWMKKKAKKEEVVEEVKQANFLKDLCGNDAALYEYLSLSLYQNPSAAISQKSLDELIAEAESSGNCGPAVDKAIFEGSQNPEDREKYVAILKSLGEQNIRTIEQEKEKAQQQNLADRVTTLEKRIGYCRYLIDNPVPVLKVATTFYNEKMLNSGEDDRREQREHVRKTSENDEWKIALEEQKEREARKKAMKHMGKEERRAAELQMEKEEQAAEARKQARQESRQEAEREELRIGDKEGVERAARKAEREGK